MNERSNTMNITARFVLAACVAAALAFSACSQTGAISRTDNSVEYTIYPDYKGVTIPCNIAPLCFSALTEGGEALALLIEGGGHSLWVEGDGGDFVIPEDGWRELTAAGDRAKTLTFTVAREENGEWVGTKPFTMTVVPDSIDEYITYRLIPPGYSGWYKMGIYQHRLSTSEQSVIYENSHSQGNCVNCHTVGSHRADRTLMHMRTFFGGTYIFRNGGIERLDTKTDSTVSAFVYPAWHPDGRHIAFSTNSTAQSFFTSHADRIEVFDSASDIVVYDADTHTVAFSPLLKGSEAMQTFPAFSPDGKWLYFCAAPAIEEPDLNYDKIKYSLCRIAFDADGMAFGDRVDTLYNARVEGRSVSFPRVSPDGRWLVCTVSDYGNFSIWHSDADLFIADLQACDPDGGRCELRPLSAANSASVESYHTWSSSGRWLVFSSRRDDGLYTRPYFAYIDSGGNASKPFMLPQRNPREYYKRLDVSYNIPEFMTSRFDMPMRDIIGATRGEEVKVKVVPGR